MEVSPGFFGAICIGLILTSMAGLLLNILFGGVSIIANIIGWFTEKIKQIFLKLGFSEKTSLNLIALIFFTLLILMACYAINL